MAGEPGSPPHAECVSRQAPSYRRLIEVCPPRRRRSLSEPRGDLLAEVAWRLGDDASCEVSKCARGKHLAHARIGLQHDGVDRADAVRRPSRRFAAKNRATAPDVAAFE